MMKSLLILKRLYLMLMDNCNSLTPTFKINSTLKILLKVLTKLMMDKTLFKITEVFKRDVELLDLETNMNLTLIKMLKRKRVMINNTKDLLGHLLHQI